MNKYLVAFCIYFLALFLACEGRAETSFEIDGIWQSRTEKDKWIVVVSKNGKQITFKVDDQAMKGSDEENAKTIRWMAKKAVGKIK